MRGKLGEIFLLCFLTTAAFALNTTSLDTEWGYKGNISPESWSFLNPNFKICATGKLQSPVNIRRNRTKETQADLQLHYVQGKATLITPAITTLTIGTQKIAVKNSNGLQITFPDAQQNMRYVTVAFHLIEMHFHSPSEHQLNGRDFPIEIHFVHQDDDGDVAILAVLANGGQPNNELQKVIQQLPLPKKPVVINFDPLQMLPAQKDFFAYPGSLTTPPCTEGLSWIVFANPITISPQQIVLLRRMVGVNARTVQPLNGRVVTFNKFK